MRDEQNRQGSTEVIIDGKVIPLSGGDSAYLRQVAAYIDNKIAELRQNRAYARQNSERRLLPRRNGKTRNWKRKYQIWKRKRQVSKQSMQDWKQKKNAWKHVFVNWKRRWRQKSSAVKILRVSSMTCSRSKTDSREE